VFVLLRRRFVDPKLGEADPEWFGGRAPQKTDNSSNGSNSYVIPVYSSKGIFLFPEKEAKSACSASQKVC
jgi:hypothetical protein